MKKTGIFYDSSSGVTADIAAKIAAKLGVDESDIHDVGNVKATAVAPYELLVLDFILGTLLGYDICQQCKRFCSRRSPMSSS